MQLTILLKIKMLTKSFQILAELDRKSKYLNSTYKSTIY